MENFDVYYFSGTGNSKKVTDWLCDEMEQSGIVCTKTDLSKNREKPEMPGKNSTLGFISPTHGFNFPPLVIHFILRFPRCIHNNPVYLINTRAGMKLSKIFLPGLSGIALWLAALILLFKGYRIAGMRSIDLPSNWISLHPGLKQKVVKSLFEHYEVLTRTLAHKIMNGKKIFRFSLLIGFPLDIAIAPVAFGYYVIGRFVIAKTFIASNACDNCMLCIKNCPVKAISLVDNRPYWSYRCESCMRCMNNCPKRAIETAHGLLVITIFIIYATVISVIYTYLPINTWPVFTGSSLSDMLARITIKSVLFFVLFLVVYRLAHYLKRYRWFNFLVVYTSLTKYSFWRRYKPKQN